MAVKTFSVGEVLTASDTNTYLANAGLVYVTSTTVGSGVSSVTVSNCFSSTYDNYRIIITGGTASTNLDLRFNFDGNTAGYYTGAIYHPYGTATGNAQGLGRNNIAYWDFVGGAGTDNSYGLLEITAPFLAKKSGFATSYVVGNTGGSGLVATGFHDSSTSFTGFRLQTSTGTITGSTITVYGYRKA